MPDVVLVIKFYLPDLFERLQLPCTPTALEANETIEDKLHCTAVRSEEIRKVAECQGFLYVLLLMKLIDDGDLKNAKEFGDFVMKRIHGINKRSMD